MQYRENTCYYEDFYLYLREAGRVFDFILVEKHINISLRNPNPGASFQLSGLTDSKLVDYHTNIAPCTRPQRGHTSLAGTAHGMHDPEGGRILAFWGG
jgi:hypothetical protein